MTTTNKTAGGSFIVEDLDISRIFTPEDFNDEHRMIADTTSQFVEQEIAPNDEQLEKLDYNLTLSLLRKAGELGLLGAEVPESFGGLALDKASATLINENIARASSFSLSVGAHVGIGTLPIVFFGTTEQKKKYLPQLASGEKIAAYCLTEPASGSDALGAKTTARISEDGKHYILNGSKIFITNAGFADIFIVYAKLNGTDFSAFIVEKGTPGFTLGPEEKKMGIKGSSTRPLFFEDAHVPVENLLGEIGKGHQIAFNILNIGRYKLGAGCIGAAKEVVELSIRYANARKQFNTPIAQFPLIGKKLAEINIRTYAMESMLYRIAGVIDEGLSKLDLNAPHAGASSATAIAEYAIECSICKVFASEGLDFVADEGVQIHGGYGYTQEYRIERIYRDSRINRIFEGTNEINRLLIPGTLVKKALKGELPLIQNVQALQAELLSSVPPSSFEGSLAEEAHLIAAAKKIFLMVGGLAVQKYQNALDKEQEVLGALADIMIQVYVGESVLLRAKKIASNTGEDKAANAFDMTQVFVREAFNKIEAHAREALVRMESGDTLRTQLSVLKKLTRQNPIDTVTLKRNIAARVIQSEKFIV